MKNSTYLLYGLFLGSSFTGCCFGTKIVSLNVTQDASIISFEKNLDIFTNALMSDPENYLKIQPLFYTLALSMPPDTSITSIIDHRLCKKFVAIQGKYPLEVNTLNNHHRAIDQILQRLWDRDMDHAPAKARIILKKYKAYNAQCYMKEYRRKAKIFFSLCGSPALVALAASYYYSQPKAGDTAIYLQYRTSNANTWTNHIEKRSITGKELREEYAWNCGIFAIIWGTCIVFCYLSEINSNTPNRISPIFE